MTDSRRIDIKESVTISYKRALEVQKNWIFTLKDAFKSVSPDSDIRLKCSTKIKLNMMEREYITHTDTYYEVLKPKNILDRLWKWIIGYPKICVIMYGENVGSHSQLDITLFEIMYLEPLKKALANCPISSVEISTFFPLEKTE